MSNKILTEYLDIENSDQKLQLEVYYSLGGMNYFNYKQEPRGYYGSVTPIKLEKHDGYTSMQFTAFSGVKTFLVECTRKNKKSAKLAKTVFEEKKIALIESVLEKMDIKTNGESISKKLGISIPPVFHNKTEEEIKNMPVQIVGINNCDGLFKNLSEAKNFTDLSKLCGAMYGEINGIPCLRFETWEAYKVLSS